MPIGRHAIFLSVLASALCAVAANAADITLTIDDSHRFQTIEGFGACLYLGADHPYDQSWYQDLYAKDLGASIIRMELTPWVLGKDMSKPVPLGEDLEANIARMDFSAAGGIDAATMIRATNARKLDRLLLIGSLWTPPHWMKTGATLTPAGNSSGGHLKMDADNLEQFARYVAAYVKGFERACGTPFYAISIQNELMFKETYNSCQYTPREYHDAIAAVGREFAKDKIATKIMGPEGVGPDAGFFTNAQMGWIDAVESDPATADYLSLFCIHGYGGNGVDILSDGRALTDYWNTIQHFGKESWMTESSGENPAWLHTGADGKEDGALSVARHIHEGLVDGNFSAILYWQCCDGRGPISRENLMGPDEASARDSGKYACAKQFFRYIRPGSQRVDVSPQTATLGASAFVNDKDNALTIVLVNTSGQGRAVALQLPKPLSARKFHVVRSTATERCAIQPDIAASAGAATVLLPAYAVVTIYRGSE
ncbi:MAG: glycoside hydrolase family 30 beta sandwich domain-containing protein [Tepidisphaeraceae bacterium]|jgi:O-glycosyl hydrolase